MNVQHYKDRLLDLEKTLSARIGRAVADGRRESSSAGPIEEKRLDAVPWTPYCLKHEQLLEASASKTPTL